MKDEAVDVMDKIHPVLFFVIVWLPTMSVRLVVDIIIRIIRVLTTR